MKRFLAFGAFILGTSASPLPALELQADTLRAWKAYVSLTEARIERELDTRAPSRFLRMDHQPDGRRLAMRRRLKLGELFVERSETLSADGQAVEVPDGMVHHWTGAVLIPDAKLEEVVAWVQNYADMERNFAEVERSELLNRSDKTFDIFLRLKRKKVLTVHYATEHRVRYREHGIGRVSSVSVATKITELDQAGTTAEREKPDDENRGFLWRLRSYWRFEQGEGGVWVECESISLSRSIPKGAAWMIRGFVESVPRESLEAALEPLRAAFSRQ